MVTWRLGRHQPSCMETSDLFIYLFFILYILLRPQRLCVLCYLSVCVRQSFSFCVFEIRRLNSECPSGSVHLSCWIVCCCCCMLTCVCLSSASVAAGESSRAPLYYFASLVSGAGSERVLQSSAGGYVSGPRWCSEVRVYSH